MSLRALVMSPLGQTLLLTAGIPFVLRLVSRIGQRSSRKPKPSSPTESVSSRRTRLSLAALLVAFALSYAFICRPLDPFTELGLSVATPTATLRRELARIHGRKLSNRAQETIAMLTTLDNRLAYLRYGDATFTPLTSAPEGQRYRFGLAMAFKLAPYAVAATGLGVLLETGGRQRRRGTFANLLFAGWLAEGYALFSDWDRETKIDRNLHLARWLGFATLFILAYLVGPTATPASPADAIAPKLLAIHGLQDRARQRLLVLSATKEAIMRDEELRHRYVDFWTKRETDDARARDDPAVQAVRTRLDLHPKGQQFEQLRAWLDENGGVKRASKGSDATN